MLPPPPQLQVWAYCKNLSFLKSHGPLITWSRNFKFSFLALYFHWHIAQHLYFYKYSYIYQTNFVLQCQVQFV